MIQKIYAPKHEESKALFSLNFKNMVGLGAGFDKNARYLTVLESLGFGFVEIGTVTPVGQEGNPKPRLFRLKEDKALINRMGFNNEGAEKIVERLSAWRKKNPSTSLIIGGNIGKNKITANEDAWKDYEKCFIALHPHVDYFVVNVSSPNTPGLRELQDKDSLKQIFSALSIYNESRERPKPVLLKIAPDLSLPQVDDVISLAMEINLDGLIVSNTTISRDNLSENTLHKNEAGGLSGAPLLKKNTTLISYMAGKLQNKIPIIASGGIFTKADAKEKLEAGASMVQVWTGFIYEGPSITKNILKQ